MNVEKQATTGSMRRCAHVTKSTHSYRNLLISRNLARKLKKIKSKTEDLLVDKQLRYQNNSVHYLGAGDAFRYRYVYYCFMISWLSFLGIPNTNFSLSTKMCYMHYNRTTEACTCFPPRQ